MERNAAEEQVLRLIPACCRDEAKVEEGLPIGLVKLKKLVSEGNVVKQLVGYVPLLE